MRWCTTLEIHISKYLVTERESEVYNNNNLTYPLSL